MVSLRRVAGRALFLVVTLSLVSLSFVLFLGTRWQTPPGRWRPAGSAVRDLNPASLMPLLTLPSAGVLESPPLGGELGSPAGQLPLPPGYSGTSTGGRMIFAHFADGEIPSLRQSMDTSFIVVNDSAYDAIGTLSFFSGDGKPAAVAIGGTTGSSFPLTLKKGETRKLITSGKGPVKSGWALLQTDQPVTGGSAFSMKNAAGRIIGEVGVAESILRTEFTLFADTMGASNTGIAIVNPSESAQLLVDLELRKLDGTFVRRESLTIPPRGHLARFLNELFRSVAGIQEFEGSVVLTGSHPFAGLTLRTLDSLLTSVPLVPPLEVSDYGSELRFPQIADGAGGGLKILTTILLFNNTPVLSNAVVEFYRSDASPWQVKIGGVKGSSFPVSLKPGAVRRLVTTSTGSIQTGWARVTSDQPLKGSAVFQIQNAAGQSLTEVGVGSGLPGKTFTVLTDSTGLYRTGIALMNASDEGDDAEATFTLFDRTGKQMASQKRDILSLSSTSFFVDELFPSVQSVTEMVGRVSIRSDVPMVALTLRQVDVLTTSVPTVIPQHGFAPRSLLEFPQNLTSTTPSVRWRIEQSGTDLSLETLEVSAPQLGLNTALVEPGDQIGQGIYFLDLGFAQIGGLIQLLATSGQGFDMWAAGPFLAPGVVISGSYEGNPSGGLTLRLGPTESDNTSWNRGPRLEMDLQLLPGLITTPTRAGNVSIVTRSTSASSKLDDVVRIIHSSSQPQSFVKPASQLHLYSQTPVFFDEGGVLAVSGKGFAASVEVGFPTAGGILWQAPWEVAPTKITVGVPPNPVEGSLLVRSAGVQGNPLHLRSLFAPSVQVLRGGGNGATVAPRFELALPARQLAFQSFQIRLLDVDRNLTNLTVGSTVGTASITSGMQAGEVQEYEIVVESSSAGLATLHLVEPGDEDPFAFLTVSKATEDGTKLVTFDFTLESPAETPVVNSHPSAIEMDLSGMLLTVTSGVRYATWDAVILSAPAQLEGADSGIRVQKPSHSLR